MTSEHEQSFQSLIASNLVTLPTRAALNIRTERQREPYPPVFFSREEFAALSVICSRLLGIPVTETAVDDSACRFIVREIDHRLTTRRTDGWRYDALPKDGDAYRQGIEAMQLAARSRFQIDIVKLDDQQVDVLLELAASGDIATKAALAFDCALWFGELLAETVECFYSLPSSLREIGYVGFADAKGWRNVGMNELEPQEAKTTTGGES